LVFARRGGRLESVCTQRCRDEDIRYIVADKETSLTGDQPPVLMVAFESRRELTYRTSQFFPQFDLFVAPAHERSHWALGLGLPMFIAGPAIGSYAPLNREWLIRDEVALPLETKREAENFGERLRELREIGELCDMALDGWNNQNINGFDTIASYFLNHYPMTD
jgi:hypothetical protein